MIKFGVPEKWLFIITKQNLGFIYLFTCLVTGGWRKLHDEELGNYALHQLLRIDKTHC
jgi:hypothetical protein